MTGGGSGQARWGRQAALLLFLLLPLWLFRDVVSGRRVFYTQDVLAYIEPKNAEILRALGEGRFPLWLSTIGCGVPFFAEVDNTVLNPVWAALLPFGPRRAIELGTPLWSALAALGLALLVREWRVGWTAAALGGISYGLSGLIVFYFDNTPYAAAAASLPLFLWAWHRAVASGSALGVGLAGLAAFFAITTGDLETVYLGAALALPYGFIVPAPAGRPRWFPAVLYLGLGVATVGLSAVQLLPTVDLLRQAPRLLPLEMIYEWTFHPLRLLELVLPFGYGSDRAGASYWGGFLHDPASPTPWTRSVYLGLPALLLAPWAFAARERRGLAWFLGVTGLIAVLASFGRALPVYAVLLRVLPLFDRFRVPSKLWVLVSLAIAGLAALGAERLLGDGRRRAAVSVAVVLAFALAALLVVPLPSAPAATLSGPALHGALVAAFAAAILAARSRLGVAAGPLLVALAAVDLARVNGQVASWFSDARVAPEQPVEAARIILADRAHLPGPYRIYHHEGLVEARGWIPPPRLSKTEARKLWDRLSLDWNHAWSWGLEEAGGYTVLQDGRPVALRAALRQSPEGAVAALGRLGVRHLLLPAGMLPPIGTTLVSDAERGAVRIVRVDQAWPRVFLARLGRTVSAPAEALAGLVHPAFDPAAQVLIEAPRLPFAGVVSAAPLGEARLLRYQPGRVEVAIEVFEPRYLVLAENRYDGWVAYVDGVRRPTLRANFLMQAVPVAPGEGRVEFRYEPAAFYRGRNVTLVSLTVLGALALRRWRGRRPARPATA